MRVIRAVAALNSGRFAASRQGARCFSINTTTLHTPAVGQIGSRRPFSGTRNVRYAALSAAEEA